MVTQKDISKYANVGVSTVGMILSGNGKRYSPSTCSKVMSAVRKLNYRPSITARGLKLNKSFLIGLLLSDANASFVSEVLRGAVSTLYDHGQGYSPIVLTHCNAEEESASLDTCLARNVDGLLVNTAISPDGSNEAGRFNRLIKSGVPIVEVFGRNISDAPSLNIDNAAAARQAVEEMLNLGHRRIAMLTHEYYGASRKNGGRGRHFDAWEQYCGYEQAMLEVGLEPIILTHSLSSGMVGSDEFVTGGLESLEQILQHPAKPTAVVCYNDYQTYGLLRACRLRNISIPQQLSICGYGDLDLSRITTPSLTTLRVPANRIGQVAMRMVLDIIENREVSSAMVEPKFIMRESLARPRGDDSC